MNYVALIAFLLTSSTAFADGFAPIEEKRAFVSLISGKALTRFGITLNVSPEGEIRGRAFGTPVTGRWHWQSGLFCRELAYGSKDLGSNCQLVARQGNTLRFTSDAGKGDYADLKLN